ncbi:MAG TPA: sigma-54 dependent transcriptional regulator [Rhodocyclaceae bacterium]|nr:sigma-54 dependent transcriptional regulator [Rhodocyclaceae bacterium]
MSESSQAKLLTLPNVSGHALSIRAKALVFNDPRSRRILDQLDRVAPSEATVLIVGETGTGKELVARHIHEQSGRRGPFVAVNCGAFSETLVESELFGHEAGAFTGAQQARVGWFEAANGGTLFLDEVGDMPLSLQVKLLRVLQERQVVRLGTRKPIPIDVRLVAATNVELDRAVEAGHFRRDLYYRLNVAPVNLPPLRERRGDLLPLVQYFLDLYSRKLGLGEVTLSITAERVLYDYDWPGNIRELENVVHFGLIMCRNGVLEASDLRLPTLGRVEAGSVNHSPMEALGHALRRLLESDVENVYETVEHVLVTTAFSYCDSNQVRTAKRLAISRNILRAQLKRFGFLGNQVDEPGEEETGAEAVAA